MKQAELAPYLSPEARATQLRELASQGKGEIVEIGQSVLGRPLEILRLPGNKPNLPRVLCTADIHGLEFIGTQVALGLARNFAEAKDQAGLLREQAELWVMPSANPDAYARTWEQAGRGKLAELRCNAHGVDLNRNFPLPHQTKTSWLPGTGSSKKGKATYRGPKALSEPESSALDTLMNQHSFTASANLHAFMGTIIPARVTDKPSYAHYKDLAKTFAKAQAKTHYRRLALRHFDVFTGELEDHQHHVHNCWAICVEHQNVFASFRQHLRAPSPFWRFNPRQPERWVENDVPGLVAYFLRALNLPPPKALKTAPPQAKIPS